MSFYSETLFIKTKEKILRISGITGQQECNLSICLIYWIKMNLIVIKS